MMYAPALAASSACAAEKHSVTLTRMPSLLRARVAMMPSRVSGHFTTMFLWIFTSLRPSSIMDLASVETTSAETSPSTMSQIMRTWSSIGRPSLAISEGLVVTPSTIPQLAAFFSSSRLAVYKKNFMRLPSGPPSVYRDADLYNKDSAFQDLLYRNLWMPDECPRLREGRRHSSGIQRFRYRRSWKALSLLYRSASRYTEGGPEGSLMKFFLYTANLDELKKAASWGIVDGVTTNPSLIAKEGRPIEDQVRMICDIVDGDVSAEVVSTEARSMIEEGRRLVKIHKNIVVKCPLTRDGIMATSTLSKEGIRVNVTLCFSAGHALLAAKAGACILRA